ncbi:sensor histidine kinase [Zemynaea arenosa]|uniref:sensor histidine kinase n=1 Tax=Zemynaea arenosa TaxID=2561931 RepID=UPI001E6275DE|nr:histidine kinase [Massilia arenosa]
MTSRTRFVATVSWLMFWALMVSVSVQDYVRSGGRQYWQPVLWETSSNVVGLVLMIGMRRILKRWDYLTATPWRWFALQLACLPIFCLLFVPITFGIRHAVYAMVGQIYEHRAPLELFFYESIKIAIFYTMFVTILFGALSYFQLLEEKLRAEQASALLRQAQLQRLTQQMQPHFLFNALNTVSSLMHSDVERADATLIQLADTLRATLEVSDLQVAPLATELRLVRGYARVMEERYADRVRIDWQIDEAQLGCEVPVMSLQPLLENVFKHTVERRRGTTAIVISASGSADELRLAVEDDSGQLADSACTEQEHAAPIGGAGGAGGNAGTHAWGVAAGPRLGAADQGTARLGAGDQDAPRPGIGIANLRQRLQVLYGERAALELVQLHPAGVRAEMRLPCTC